MLLLVFLALNITITAQENRTDASGLKQGPWIKKYPTGKILYEGVFKDNNPVGEFKRYYEDGTLQSVLTFNESGSQAAALFYHPNGLKAAEGNYIDKKKEGLWKYYSAKTEGYKVSEENFLSDKRHGLSRKFYSTGEIAETLNYINGIKEGEWLQFYVDGKVCLKATYVNDRLEGTFLFCHPNGSPQAVGKYTADLRHGWWKIYNEDGTLKKQIEYKNGKLADSSLNEKETSFLDDLEKNKGKILDPEMTGNEKY